MAKAAAKTTEAVAAAEPKKGKGKLLIILGAVLLLVLGGGGAAYYFMLKGKPAEAEAQEAKAKPKAPPLFERLEPFVVNLADRGRYLQVVMELRIPDTKTQAEVKKLLPEIRNGILLVLSGKRADEVSSSEGKQRLQLEIRQQANKALGIEFTLPPLPKPLPEGTDPAVIEAARAEFDKLAEAAKASLAKVDGIGVTDVLFTSFVIQ